MVLALKVPRKNVRVVLLYTHFRGLLMLKISITGLGGGVRLLREYAAPNLSISHY